MAFIFQRCFLDYKNKQTYRSNLASLEGLPVGSHWATVALLYSHGYRAHEGLSWCGKHTSGTPLNCPRSSRVQSGCCKGWYPKGSAPWNSRIVYSTQRKWEGVEQPRIATPEDHRAHCVHSLHHPWCGMPQIHSCPACNSHSCVCGC